MKSPATEACALILSRYTGDVPAHKFKLTGCKNERQRARERARVLQGLVKALEADLNCLELEQGKLALKADVLSGTLAASRLTVEVLERMLEVETAPAQQVRAALDAALAVEELLQPLQQSVCEKAPEVLGCKLEPWIPSESCRGCAKTVMASFLNQRRMDGPSQASLLGGGPLSFMHACLILIKADPEVQETCQAMQEAGADVLKAFTAQVRVDTSKLLATCTTPDGQPIPGSPATTAIAELMLHAWAIAHVAAISCPMFIHRDGTASNLESTSVAALEPLPPAPYDMALEEMHLAPQQLRDILRIIHTFQDILAPLEKEKAAIAERLAALLRDPAAAGGWSTRGRAAAVPTAVAAAVAGSLGMDGSKEAAAWAWGEGLSCPLLASGVHEKLFGLAGRLRGLALKLYFLDISCGYYAQGVLTWWQFAKLFVSTAPYQPSMLTLARRLAARTSLPLLIPVWPSIPDAPAATKFRGEQETSQLSALESAVTRNPGVPLSSSGASR